MRRCSRGSICRAVLTVVQTSQKFIEGSEEKQRSGKAGRLLRRDTLLGAEIGGLEKVIEREKVRSDQRIIKVDVAAVLLAQADEANLGCSQIR